MHLLICTSTKSKRISHSTSHAETNACARAIPGAQLVAMRLAEPEMAKLCLARAVDTHGTASYH